MPFAREAETQRICWKCEGSVSIHMPQCPYCSAFLQDPPEASSGFASCHLSLSEETPSKQGTEDLFTVSTEDWDAVLSEQRALNTSNDHVNPNMHWSWLQYWPMAALFLGVGLAAFAVVILLFATDAGLTLSWPKNRAYLYGCVGALLAYRGYTRIGQ
ncbi:putative inner membrane protein [Chlamydia ibidis]|uniref:Inner membrane protein n=2 Tax=Chlamydia ibidis TaxID=1405396 RepID=A0ABP2XCW6_9CHLA|nr:phage holin family protein [Chlamydia ibidis]EPP34743.1 putative inner membrane protein [Chlamydia ibidis]EQM62288.1 putative inner membrane protein [Chlamydia ibidis 10-1398/6]